MIWGAAGGIGRALTDKLLADGWQVVALTRKPEKLNGKVITIAVDNAANAAQVDQAIYQAQFEVDGVDLWIYSAGDIVQARVDELEADAWRRVVEANLTGAYVAAHASLSLLNEDASMYFLGAVSERLMLPGLSAYVAAKAGLEAFAATLAKEQRKRKVTVVRPGAVDTDFWQKVSLKKPNDIAKPEQIADRIVEAYHQGYKGTLDITH